MDKPKPIRHDQVVSRALLIACELMATLEVETKPGSGPATPYQIRRALTGKARRELLRERKEKNP